MQPPQSQHSNVLISLVGIANQEPSQASSQKLLCSKCRFSTKDHELFERHLAQHAGVTFTCNICGHISYTKVESQRHAVQHSGKFPFKCEFCSYGAVRRDYVVKHVQRVHSRKRPGSHQDGRPNVLIMGDVSLASVPKVGVPTLIDVTEQVTKASTQPFDVVPNWIPLTVNQSQINGTSHLSSMLNKPVGVTSNRHLNSQTQYVGLASKTDSRLTNLVSSGAPSQLISLTSVRIPNATNDTNGNAANNNLLAGRQPKPYTGHTSLKQVTSIAPDVLSIIPSQAIHMAVPNVQNASNHSVRRTPPNILRKNQQRPVGLVSDATNRNRLVGNQSASSSGKVLTNLNQFVAANGVNVAPPSTSLSTLRQPQQISTGIGSKPSYVSINGAVSQACVGSSSNRIPINLSQAFLGNSNMSSVSSSQTTRPALGAVSNLQGKMTSLASNGPLASAISSLGCLTSRSPSIVSQSLNPQNKTMESYTSLQSRVPVVSDINGELELSSPVQVELLEPLNQPINHNRTLTVSFPEEVSIPPGSLVELVEVKTVNGAQEMQFRIVPQQIRDKSASDTAAVGVGAPALGSSLGRVVSGDKWSSKSGTDLCQTPSMSKASLLKTSSAPTTNLSTHTAGRVKVKEEPIEHDCFHAPLTRDSNKGKLSVTNPGNLATSPPTPVLKERKKVQSVSHSLSVPRNQLPVTSSNAAVSGGFGTNSKVSATPVEKHSDCKGDMETEGLPVILSVYSLECSPECEGFPSTVESLPHAVGANNHEASTSAEDCVDNLLIPCQSSVAETLSQYLQQEGDYVMPPVKMRVLERPEKEKERAIQASRLNTQNERLTWEPATWALLKRSQTDAPNRSTDCHSNPRLDSPECKPVETHPPQQRSKFSLDTDAIGRTNCNIQISVLEQRSYAQLFTLVPKVSLERLSSKHQVPPSEKTSEKHIENVSLTARPVLSCASNKQNLAVHQQPCHEVLKLRLKRKKCDSDNESSDIFEALPTPESSVEPFSFPEERQHNGTVSIKRQRSSGMVISQKFCLTPAKEDQLVKFPGPNQPVVILNHPHPRDVRLDHSHQSPAHSRGIAPLRIVLTRDTHKIVPEIVRSPSLKMKFKKVQGNQYQVTELLAEGISDKLVL